MRINTRILLSALFPLIIIGALADAYATTSAFVDGTQQGGAPGIANPNPCATPTTLASLSTSFPAGDNLVIAAVQSIDTLNAARTIPAANLLLDSGTTVIQKNTFDIQIPASPSHNSFVLLAKDVGAPANPSYSVTACADGNKVNAQARFVAISGMSSNAFINGTSTSFNTAETPLATLSTSLPAGDNIILAEVQISNGPTGQTILAGNIKIKDGATVIVSNPYAMILGTAASTSIQQILLVGREAGAGLNPTYTVTITGGATGGSAVARVLAFQPITSAFLSGTSTAVGTTATNLGTLTTTLSSGETVIIGSAQFKDATAGIETYAAATGFQLKNTNNRVSVNNTMQMEAMAAAGSASDSFNHALIWRNATESANPSYLLQAAASATGQNGQEMLVAFKVGSIFSQSLAETSTFSDSRVSNPTKVAPETVTSSDGMNKSPNKVAPETVTSSDGIAKSASKFLTENISLTDAVSFAAQFIKNITDSLLFADTNIRAFSKKLNDQITLSDTVDHTGTFFRTFTEMINYNDNIGKAVSKVVAEAMNLGDTTSKSLAISRTLSETLTLADNTSKTTAKVVMDTFTLADTTAKTGTFSRTLSESIGIADTIAKLGAFSRTFTESIGMADTITKTASFFKTISESITLADTVSKTGTFFRTMTESIGVADAIAKAASFSRTFSESIGVADVTSKVSLFSRTLTESMGIADTLAKSASFSRTFTESIGVADTVSKTGTFFRTMSESIGIADTIKSSGTFFRTLSESISLADTISKTGTFFRTLSESISLADTISKTGTFFRTLSESIGIADTISKTGTFSRTLAESIGISDTITKAASFSRNLSESVGIADTVSKAGTFSRTLTESVGLADTVSKAASFSRTLSESIGMADTTSKATSFSRTFSESIGIADSVSKTTTFSRTLSESIGMADTIAKTGTFAKVLTESIGITDTVSKTGTFSRTLTESVGIADTIAKVGAFSRTFTESMGITDAITKASSFSRTFTESMGITDAITKASSFSRNLSESIGIADTVSKTASFFKTISESITLADTVSKTGTFFRTLSESIGIADTIKSSGTFFRTLAESIGLADTISKTGAFSKTISESITLSDTVTKVTSFSRSLSESISLADTISKTGTFFRTLSESIGVADTISKTGTFSRTMIESIGIADTVSKAGTLSRTLSESIGLADTVSKTGTFSRTLTESVGIADTVSKAGTLSRVLTESVGIADTLASKTVFSRTLTESLAMSDVVNVAGVISKTLTETISIGDSVSANTALAKALSESFTLFDTVRTILTTGLPSSPTESLGLSDFISLKHEVPTGTGSPVNISLLGGSGVPGGTTITYSVVTSAGITSVTTRTTAEPLPSGLIIAGLGGSTTSIDISTTAVFSGSIQECVTFSDAGITPQQKAAIQLRHLEGGTWVDVTTSRDTDKNIACGQTNSLSPFAVMFPAVPPTATSANVHRGDSTCNTVITNNPNAFGQCVVVDTTPPEIIGYSYQPDVPVAGKELTMTADIQDNVGLSKAYMLYFVTGKTLEFHQVPMQLSQGHFTGTIPASDVRTVGLRYWIFAEDLAGNTVQSSVKNITVAQAPPLPEEKTKQYSIPASVLAAIKPIPVTPTQKLEVISLKSGNEIKSLPDKIVIRNIGNLTADNIRIMLSSDIYKNFRLSHSMINSIAPHSNVTITLQPIGAPNRDVLGNLVGYQGNVLVIGEHLSPITLPVNVAGEKSDSLSSFMDKVENMAEQRYNKLSLINSILKQPKVQSNYEVTTSNKDNIITKPSGEIVIKNLSDKELQNIRIVISGAGNVFLLDNKVIQHLAPHAQISIRMIPTIDTKNYSPKDIKGELLIVPSNDNPIHIPINIPSVERKDSANEFDASTLLGKDGIFTAADKVVIKNLGNRTMDSVKLMLSSNLARVLTLNNDSFQHIEPNGKVVVDVKFKEEKGTHNGLEYNYQGELVVMSEHHMQKVIPINITWKEFSSDHFTIYARNNQTDMAKAKDLLSFLESNYHNITSRFGEMNAKARIYMTHSIDELRAVTKSDSYYAFSDDTIFICGCSYDLKSLAMKEFVHRIIFNEFPAYANKQKFLLDGENWLINGIANYIAANMTGEHGMVKKELEAFKAKPTSSVWYGSGSLEQYGAAYTFFEYLHEKYGDKMIDRTLYYLQSGMVSNHRCDTLEDCAVLRAVYDVNGWSMHKSYAHTVDVKTLVSEWEDYVTKNYNTTVSKQL